MQAHIEEGRSGMVWDDIELSWTASNVVMPACTNTLASRQRRLANNMFNHLAEGPPFLIFLHDE